MTVFSVLAAISRVRLFLESRGSDRYHAPQAFLRPHVVFVGRRLKPLKAWMWKLE